MLIDDFEAANPFRDCSERSWLETISRRLSFGSLVARCKTTLSYLSPRMLFELTCMIPSDCFPEEAEGCFFTRMDCLWSRCISSLCFASYLRFWFSFWSLFVESCFLFSDTLTFFTWFSWSTRVVNVLSRCAWLPILSGILLTTYSEFILFISIWPIFSYL